MNQLAFMGNSQQTSYLIGNQLVQQHEHLVKRIAYHLHGRLPDSVQIDDLIQAGLIALLDAHSRFDTNMDTPFEKFASIRIRGAMLDEVRRHDWIPRSVHQKSRQISDTIRILENRYKRDVTDREVAKELGLELEEYQQMLYASTGKQVLSLDMMLNEDEILYDALFTDGTDTSKVLELEELRTTIAKIVAELPEREQLVISLYYVDELNLREIGQVIGVSESRVCQIHNQTLLRMRARIEEALGVENM